jgi:hypothetical protein
MSRKFAVLFVVVALVLTSLTGCSAGAVSEETLANVIPNFDAFSLRIPRIYIQYVETDQGYAEPAVWGLRASQLEAWFGANLSMVKIPDFYMDWLKASNVQHIEMAYSGDGLFLYANGQPMPYIAWDADSVGLSGKLVAGMGVANGALIQRMMPLLRHIALDVVVVMPVADGAEFIPYRDDLHGFMPSTAAAEIAEPEAVLNLEVTYSESGVPTFLGMPAEMLQPLLGSIPGQLDPGLIASLKQIGASSITLQTQGDGLFVRVNDQALPHLAWSPEHLANALDLYAQMNETSWVPNEAFVDMVSELVLRLTSSDIQLKVTLP